MSKKSRFIMLIGSPFSGKSTYRLKNYPYMPCLSTDDLIERHAAQHNTTYDAMFESYFPEAKKILWNNFLNHVEARRDFIWDQTNGSVKKRANILNHVKQHYFKECIYFNTPHHVLLERKKERESSVTGKTISEDVIRRIKISPPEFYEGWDKITTIALPDRVHEILRQHED